MENKEPVQEPSTTDPRPPAGDTPATPPLSTASLLATPQEIKVPKVTLDHLIKANEAMLISTFTVNAADTRGTHYFSWSSQDPFPNYTAPNIHWALFQHLYSRQYDFDPYLLFKPVKIGDTPTFFDVFMDYVDSDITTTTDIKKYQNDTAEFEITDETEILLKVPLYKFLTRLPSQTTSPSTRTPPVFAPRTNIRVQSKNVYAPTAVHPQTYSVLVFLLPNLKSFNKVSIHRNTVPWTLA